MEQTKPYLRPEWLKTGLRLGISALLLYFLSRKFDLPPEFWQVFQGRQPGVFVFAALLYLASQLLSTLRLRLLLRESGYQMAFLPLLRLYFLGMFYNLLLPGGIGGDGYKVVQIRKHFQARYQPVLRILLLDRLSGALALVWLFLLLAPFSSLQLPGFSAQLFPPLALMFCLPLSHVLMQALVRLEWKAALQMSLYAMGIQLVQFIGFLLLLNMLEPGGYWADYGLLFWLSSLASALPISLGGLGAREASFSLLPPVLGLQTEVSEGLAASLLFSGISLLISLSGLLAFLFPAKPAEGLKNESAAIGAK